MIDTMAVFDEEMRESLPYSPLKHHVRINTLNLSMIKKHPDEISNNC